MDHNPLFAVYCEVQEDVMILDPINLDTAAARYSARYGTAAYERVGSEISSAVGRRDWDGAYYLQRLQWRIRKLERFEQLSEQANRHGIALGISRRAHGASGTA
jgi:hypothetical protein